MITYILLSLLQLSTSSSHVGEDMDGEDRNADYMEGEDTDGEHIDSDEDLDGIGCTEDTDEDEEMDGDDDNANVGSNSGGRSTNSMVNMVI
jgi:hypothetical protein